MVTEDRRLDLNAWWATKQAEGKTAVEAAREFGVDIEQLRHMRQLTPDLRMAYLESMLDFVLEARESIQRQKDIDRRERAASVQKTDAPSG